MADSDTLVFFCNGFKVMEENPDPDMTLLTYLRTKLHLTGTKAGCGQGGCGACTVMVSSAHPTTKHISHLAVTACIYPLCLIHGKAVTTVEGLGSMRTGLHVVQERLAKNTGSQCGFCSPGMIMSVYALLRTNATPSLDDILTSLEGNLCRCTGYRPILDGFRTFCGENCHCAQKEKQAVQKSEVPPKDCQDCAPFDPTQEPIFPPELLVDIGEYTGSKDFRNGEVRWITASSLDELLQLKQQHPAATLIVGNTIMGNKRRTQRAAFPLVISPGPSVELLTRVTTSDLGVVVGGGVTMTRLDGELKRLIKVLPGYQTRTFRGIVALLRQYASPQIRNMATLGGTIWSFSKRGDLVPLLMACGASATLVEVGGERRVMLDESYKAKSGTVMKRTEIVTDVFIPFTSQNEYCYAHKISQRRRNCLATVSCTCFVTMHGSDAQRIAKLVLVYGGECWLGPITFYDRALSQDTLKEVLDHLLSSITQTAHQHENDLNNLDFKKSLMATCLIRSFVTLCRESGNDKVLLEDTVLGVPLDDESLTSSLASGTLTSTQIFQPLLEDQTVGLPLVDMSGLEQCSGEAVYVDDIPPVDGELFAAPVLSTEPHAKILSVDPSQSLAVRGVESFISHGDVPGVNGQLCDPTEECFVSERVEAIGQTVGVVVARDRQTALKAAKLVQVQYEAIEPAIITIEDAIKHSSYLEREPRVLTRGDVEAEMGVAPRVLEGELTIGGQDHFDMEPRACIAKPLECDGMDLTLTSQHLYKVQMNVAHCLGVPADKVACHTTRPGGAFGGQIHHRIQYAMVTAIAAHKTRKPVRLCLGRHDDTLMKGFRSPFLVEYRVGFNTEGRITALDVKLYVDSGWSTDHSGYILGQAMLQLDSVYSLKNFRVTGYLCKTNKPSSTSMRAFGVPQGMVSMEHIISEVALSCGVTQQKTREINFKSMGEAMYDGQAPPDMCAVRKCWKSCLEQCRFQKRWTDIQAFNQANRWKKRGIAIIPTEHGIGYRNCSLTQGAAMVHVYTDGSVLLNHEGIEMKQGLYTSCIQIASSVLGVPTSKINTSNSSTDPTPNTTPTSPSTDTNPCCGAVKIACETLLERLKPFKGADPGGKWEDRVSAANTARVSLSARALYKLPGTTWSWETKTGNPFVSCSYGACASEVEVDCLTGEHCVLRTDIVMDTGRSINPTLDVGQIEGAFVQGYGYFTMEQLKMSSRDGTSLTLAPQTYKIPLASDVPAEFKVTLLREGVETASTVYSSEAIGEPPVILASSVFFAIKDAVASARLDAGMIGPFCLKVPAGVEEVRMACGERMWSSQTK